MIIQGMNLQRKILVSNKHVSEKSTEKPWSITSSNNDSASCELKSCVPRKNSEVLVNPFNQGVNSTTIKCDATSAVDVENDGTSDGKLASMDKKDDDESNSEQSLASKVCAFTSSGSNFMEQHWYFCCTCDLTVSKGFCSICARICTGVSSVEPFLPLLDERDHLQPFDSDSDLGDDGNMNDEKPFKFFVPKEEDDGLLSLMEMDIEGQVLMLCRQLLPSINVASHSVLSNDEKIVMVMTRFCLTIGIFCI
jgi:E3 ubiquitin-protein ligase UBR4